VDIAVRGKVDGHQVTQQLVLRGRWLCDRRRGVRRCGGVAARRRPPRVLQGSLPHGPLLPRHQQAGRTGLLPQGPCLRGREGPSGVRGLRGRALWRMASAAERAGGAFLAARVAGRGGHRRGGVGLDRCHRAPKQSYNNRNSGLLKLANFGPSQERAKGCDFYILLRVAGIYHAEVLLYLGCAFLQHTLYLTSFSSVRKNLCCKPGFVKSMRLGSLIGKNGPRPFNTPFFWRKA